MGWAEKNKCENCGHNLNIKDKYCPQCGKRISSVGPSRIASYNLLLIFLTVILLMVLINFIFWLVGGAAAFGAVS